MEFTERPYEQPKIGDADHSDPNFKPRLRPCGKCQRPFETSAKWRYFCRRCRLSPEVRRGLRNTFSISRKGSRGEPG